MEGSRARKERDGMFVFVVTPPSAVVELRLFNDVVREVLFMLSCACVCEATNSHFYIAETVIVFGSALRLMCPRLCVSAERDRDDFGIVVFLFCAANSPFGTRTSGH